MAPKKNERGSWNILDIGGVRAAAWVTRKQSTGNKKVRGKKKRRVEGRDGEPSRGVFGKI